MGNFSKDIGNILGCTFDKEIGTQINKRQELLLKKQKSDDDIRFLNSKTPWIRMSSSVNIHRSDKLAKDNVLFGGTSVWDKGIKKGFEQTYHHDDDLGYRPMSGIERVSIKTLTGGSIKKAEVTIKAYSIEQFHIIEKLYMRPGYSVLIEWGHSIYLHNEEGVKNWDTWLTAPYKQMFSAESVNIGPSYEEDFIGPKEEEKMLSPQEKMFEDIKKEKKKHYGNYGAFYGRIVNFNWSFSENIYTIKIEVISHGDVIESLKMGTATVTKQEIGEDDEDKPLIEKYKDEDEFIELLYYINTLSKVTPYVWKHKEEGKRFRKYNNIVENKIKGFKRTEDILYYKLYYFKGARGDTQSEAYIRLGSLLKYFESGGNIKLDNDVPYLKFDNNQEYNLFKSNIKLHRNDLSNLPSDLGIQIKKQKIFEGLPLFKKQKVTLGNISLDPSICLVKSPIIKSLFVGGVYDTMGEFICNKTNLGKLMNIYFNINHLADKYWSLKSSHDGKISLYEFLDSICDDINRCFGNLCNVEPKIDPDTNRLFFRDNTNTDYEGSIDGAPTKDTPTKFNIYGLGSFVKEPKFSVTINKEFASMITIGAQAGEAPLDRDSTSVFMQNKKLGLTDRISPNKLLNGDSFRDNINKLLDLCIKYNDYINNFINPFVKITQTYMEGGHEGKYIETNVASTFDENTARAFQNTGRDLYNLVIGLNIMYGNEPAPFFLPFELELTMDGLSGMRIYERFGITNKSSHILPEMYRNGDKSALEFLIKEVNEEINLNSWDTTIKGMSIPIRD